MSNQPPQESSSSNNFSVQSERIETFETDFVETDETLNFQEEELNFQEEERNVRQANEPGKLSETSVAARPKKKWGVTDTAIFSIAGLMLGTWLLGTLLVTIFPARKTNIARGAIASKATTKASGTQQMKSGLVANGETNRKEVSAQKPKLASSGMDVASVSADTPAAPANEVEIPTAKPVDNANSWTADPNASDNNLISDKTFGQNTDTREVARDVSKDIVTNRAADNQINDSASKTAETESNKADMAKDFATNEKKELPGAGLALTSPADKTAPGFTNPTTTQPGFTDPNSVISNDPVTAKTDVDTMAESSEKTDVAVTDTKESSSTQIELDGLTNKKNETPYRGAVSPMRDWVSNTGGTARMAFIRWKGTDKGIFINDKNKIYEVPMSRFSEEDKTYLLNLATPKK